MAGLGNSILVGLGDVASIAGVSRPAVSNWRKRHQTFPAPRLQTASGPLFALSEVEQWLVEQDKIPGPVPPATVLWPIAAQLRGAWSQEQLWRFMQAALAYLVASTRAEDGDARLRIAPEDRWEAVACATDARLLTRMIAAARRIEAANPALRDLLVPGLSQQPGADTSNVRRLMAGLDAAQRGRNGECDPCLSLSMLEEWASRFSLSHTTPENLAMLMVRVLSPVGPDVLDLAAGHGVTLLSAARQDVDRRGPTRLVGLDVDPEQVRAARAWSFACGVDIELRIADSLGLPLSELPTADTVMVDPPYSLPKWGDVALYLDDRWTLGRPPSSSADFAWLQMALHALRPGGRAAVVLPATTTTVGGRPGAIRTAIIETGCVEAVILLPERARQDTSTSLALWILKHPSDRSGPETMLLVDGSRYGTVGEKRMELTPEAVDRIVHRVQRHRARVALPEDASDDAVVVCSRDRASLGFDRRRPSASADKVQALRRRAATLRERVSARIRQTREALDQLEGRSGDVD